MTIEEAIALNAKHRKVGTIRLTPEERALAQQALRMESQHRLATDPVYARQYHKMYRNLCLGTGRLDLLAKTSS